MNKLRVKRSFVDVAVCIYTIEKRRVFKSHNKASSIQILWNCRLRILWAMNENNRFLNGPIQYRSEKNTFSLDC